MSHQAHGRGSSHNAVRMNKEAKNAATVNLWKEMRGVI